MAKAVWFILGVWSGAMIAYQIGYSRGMDWVWKNIVKRNAG